MISLFTRAMISSTTWPSELVAFFGTTELGFLAAGTSGSGAAICGFSNVGGFCAGAGSWAGGFWAGGFCAIAGHAANRATARAEILSTCLMSGV